MYIERNGNGKGNGCDHLRPIFFFKVSQTFYFVIDTCCVMCQNLDLVNVRIHFLPL